MKKYNKKKKKNGCSNTTKRATKPSFKDIKLLGLRKQTPILNFRKKDTPIARHKFTQIRLKSRKNTNRRSIQIEHNRTFTKSRHQMNKSYSFLSQDTNRSSTHSIKH
jgi:hypothetical protein